MMSTHRLLDAGLQVFEFLDEDAPCTRPHIDEVVLDL